VSPKRLKTVIKRLRQAKGLSQRALAARVGVTAAYITMLERGKKINPSLPTLRKLAKALGVPMTELLG
jgi:transcriptional regulator with XRE-family HTH domain